ncbi:hypothetical protein ACFTAO_35210 [Paenibacillus rhizoplanae]
MDRGSSGRYCRSSEPGVVEAWRDDVHEQGTREYGSGSIKKWIS